MIKAGCKVNDCTEAHSKHYCKNCKNPDSNHKSSQCGTVVNNAIKCKANAKGCTEAHFQHYCKNCKDPDSNHQSSQCGVVVNNAIRCKASARGCTEAHSKHYCKNCKESDSNHKSSQCTEEKSILLYHGTRASSMQGISNQGLMASADGRLGQGLYLTTKKCAIAISKSRGQGTGVVIFECRVKLQKCWNAGTAADKMWQQSYDSCSAMHPPWVGLPEFPEWCVKDAKKCKIKKIYLTDGIIDGNINFPGVSIKIDGSCTFKGNVTAGKVTSTGKLLFEKKFRQK